MRRLYTSVAALAVALVPLAGCESDAPRGAELPPEPSEPIRAAEAGVEVLSWAVDDSTGAVGRALAPYSAAQCAPGSWRASGLRMLCVKRADLEAMAAAMPTVGPLRRQWFGMLASWTPVFTGRAWAGREAVAVEEDGRVVRPSLGPGRLRLLVRCWSEPRVNTGESGAPAAAALRVEVVPQHEDAEPPVASLSFGARMDQTKKGQVFEGLGASFIAEAGMAYVIVPETPSADWATAEEASNDRPLGPPRLVENAAGDALPPTLGEAMLTDASAGGMARTRVMLVIVPRTPEKFELIR